MEDTGYGISSHESGEESYEPISVNFVGNTVSYEQEVFTFEEFVSKF